MKAETPRGGMLAKASFDAVYNLPDPRAYFRVLEPLDYKVPQFAQPVFRRCIRVLRLLRRRDDITVLDLCCGYGVNAALVNHHLTLRDLYRHYGHPEFTALGAAEMFRVDRRFYAGRRRLRPVRMLGIDVADRALAYAEGLGLLDTGFAANLEEEKPPDPLARLLARVDLVTVTGGLSYIGARTFAHLLDAMPEDRRPWIAFFPLRTTDVGGLIETFRDAGLTTERWRRLIPQRSFRNASEREQALEQVRAAGFDPAGKEERGYYYAAFHLARPESDAIRVPLAAVARTDGPQPHARPDEPRHDPRIRHGRAPTGRYQH